VTQGCALGVIGLDVYGTLVDPAAMALELRKAFGTQAQAAAQLWREKQLEYTFRRALMRKYVDFDSCTLQALRYVGASLGASLDEAGERALLESYLHLPPFPDVRTGLAKLARAGHKLVALTNGTERSAHAVLQNAGISEYLESILSADRIGTFKPDPGVYALLNNVAGSAGRPRWLVSGNPFDVIGAKAAGVQAAWLRRDAQRVFDPWEFSADLVIRTLDELCDRLDAPEMTQ